MKLLKLILVFLVLSISTFSQTKNETLLYINTLLQNHSNGTMLDSFSTVKIKEVLIQLKSSLPKKTNLGNMIMYIRPIGASRITYTNSSNVAIITLTFNPKSF